MNPIHIRNVKVQADQYKQIYSAMRTPLLTRIRAGAVAGVIAGLIKAFVGMVYSYVQGFGFWTPINYIAAFVLGEGAILTTGIGALFIGLFIHIIVSAGFGAFFGSVIYKTTTALSALIGGASYGAVIWFVMTYLVLPLMNPLMSANVSATPVVWFGLHLVFGALLFTTPSLLRKFDVRFKKSKIETISVHKEDKGQKAA